MKNIAGVIIIRNTGTIYSCNNMFMQYLFGYTTDELLYPTGDLNNGEQPVSSVHISHLLPQYFAIIEKFDVLYEKHIEKWNTLFASTKETPKEIPPAYASFRSYPKLQKTKDHEQSALHTQGLRDTEFYDQGGTLHKLKVPAELSSHSTGSPLKSGDSPAELYFDKKHNGVVENKPVHGKKKLSHDPSLPQNLEGQSHHNERKKSLKSDITSPILAKHKDGSLFWVDIQMKRIEGQDIKSYVEAASESSRSETNHFYYIWITYDRERCLAAAAPKVEHTAHVETKGLPSIPSVALPQTAEKKNSTESISGLISNLTKARSHIEQTDGGKPGQPTDRRMSLKSMKSFPGAESNEHKTSQGSLKSSRTKSGLLHPGTGE
jgi:hypothetical protein